MSQAIVDPAELRRFARNLKQFSIEVSNSMSLLRGQMASLTETWRDQEQLKFTEEFEQTVAQVGRFLQATEDHVPFLLRKAERIEAYLQQR